MFVHLSATKPAVVWYKFNVCDCVYLRKKLNPKVDCTYGSVIRLQIAVFWCFDLTDRRFSDFARLSCRLYFGSFLSVVLQNQNLKKARVELYREVKAEARC